jgi:hypothetical protein
MGMFRVGQNRIYTPYVTVCLVIPLPELQYIRRIYMVLAHPRYVIKIASSSMVDTMHKAPCF